ncbi:MAG: WD40 repeat domain-containing protein, partial [Dehalococcoidia bacterium]|nr:WD40 repeat domain-containing protein [Dehalococcoidia bacterium]
MDSSFQEGIDVILGQEPIDIAVFILWNRLGSPLGKSILTPDGDPYRSGTEREFDLMLAAREASGGARPDILFYRRSDDAGFNERLDARTRRDEELEQLLEQRKLARAFVEERFRDEEGHNTRAYHSFDRPVDFAQRLRVHLRGLIDRHIEGASAPYEVRWTEAPYRGLETFQLEYADIFFGRDEEIYRLESLLRRRERDEENPCAFAAVIGASGSGKSSLVRAGLRASLLRYNLDESIAQWRSVMLVPGQTEGRPLEALLAILAEKDALPELAAAGIAAADLATEFADNPRSATRLCLAPALRRAAEKAGGAVKLLVAIDQFEELFTDPRIGEDQRETFLRALREMAQSGHCWVVITLRSDFYPVVQRSAAFLELKGGSGQFDLLPPGPEALRCIVTEPARLAGIRYERREPDGLSLASRILEDAQNQPDLLPLLSDLLLDLYLKRRVSDDTITFETYEGMGGLEGALSQRAEALFSGLSPAQQALLPEVLHALITVEAGSEAFAVRRRAARDALRDSPEKAGLVDALIAGRLLTAECGPRSAVATVSMAHEALIRGWARVADWVRENRDFLHIRSRVEQAQRRWEESGRDESLLLPAGLALEEGISLIGAEGLHLLRGSEYDLTRLYITQSREREEERQRREREHTRNLIEEARSNEGQGWLLRAQVAEERGHRYPGTLLYAARAIGFDGVGRPEDEDLSDLPRPILIGRDPELYDRARRWIAERPAYLPVWCAPAGESPALCLSVSPEGRHLAAGFANGSVRLWDFATEKYLTLPADGAGPAHAVAFHPGGGRLAIAQGGAVRFWQIESGKFDTAAHPGAVRALAYSPDGAILAGAAEDGSLLLWRDGAADPERLATGESGPAARLWYSPDQSAIAAAFPGAGLRLYFPEAGQPHSAWAEHRGDFAALAFSPDGTRLAAGSAEGTVSLWDVAGARLLGEAVPQQRHTGAVRDLSFQRGGGQVSSASADGTLKLWDVTDPVPEIVATFTGHEGAVEVAAFLPGGALLASAGADGGARLWDVTGRVGSESDLYAYVERRWYGFDPETQEACWADGAAGGWLNLPPRCAPAILRSGSGGGFDLLLETGDWPGAALAAASPAERERLAALLLADAEDAAKEGRWHRVRLRLSQREAL